MLNSNCVISWWSKSFVVKLFIITEHSLYPLIHYMANLYLYLKLSFLETYNKNCLKKFARIFRCLSKISKTCFYMIANPHCIWYTKSYVLLSLTRENLIQREGLDSLRIALETKTGTFSSCLRSLHISPEERQPSA